MIKFELTLDPSKAEDQKTLVAIINAIYNSNEEAPTAEEKPAVKSKPRKAAKSTPEPEPEPEPEPDEKDESPFDWRDNEEAITVKDVRSLLSVKVGDHRKEIKDKLAELGANNVTSLDEEHYPAFVEFLQGLD